jgi:hypothetical protein
MAFLGIELEFVPGSGLSNSTDLCLKNSKNIAFLGREKEFVHGLGLKHKPQQRK